MGKRFTTLKQPLRAEDIKPGARLAYNGWRFACDGERHLCKPVEFLVGRRRVRCVEHTPEANIPRGFIDEYADEESLKGWFHGQHSIVESNGQSYMIVQIMDLESPLIMFAWGPFSAVELRDTEAYARYYHDLIAYDEPASVVDVHDPHELDDFCDLCERTPEETAEHHEELRVNGFVSFVVEVRHS